MKQLKTTPTQTLPPHLPNPDATDTERYLAVRPAMPAMPPVLLCQSLLKLFRRCQRKFATLNPYQ